MKNYLGQLHLMRKASESDLQVALEDAKEQTADLSSILEAEAVLLNAVTRNYYERTHLQYEAIAASLSCLERPDANDTHRWTERLVEFVTVDDDTLE